MAMSGLLVSNVADAFPAAGLGSSISPDFSVLACISLILAIVLKMWRRELLEVKVVW